MKKALIYTVTAGNGHNSASAAVKNELEKQGVEVKVVDILKAHSNPMYFWVADEGYNLAVKFLLPLFNEGHRTYKKRDSAQRFDCPIKNTVLSCIEGVYREIYDFQPDVIYGPHFYVGALATFLKVSGYPFPPKILLSMLDYYHTPFWETGIGADKFVLSGKEFVEESYKLGYTENQVETWGIPIKEQFLRTYDKKEMREKIGLKPDKFTVLVMFGGGNRSGTGAIFRKLLRALKGREAQIIKINGLDERSYRATERQKKHLNKNLTVVNVKFTDEVEKYIAASDIAVTKCGGLSSTEFMCLHVPMLVQIPLPAQEKFNLAHWKEFGSADDFRTAGELKKKLTALIDCPEKLAEMQKNAGLFHNDAVLRIAEWIVNQPDADYRLQEEIDFSKVKATVNRVLKKRNAEAMKK